MLKRLYFWLFGPICRKISAETNARLSEFEAKQEATVQERVDRLVRANLEYQEEFATKVMDQIVGAHLEIEKFSALVGADDGVVGDEKYDNELISTILSRITREVKITQLAAEYQIPLRNILVWRSKYNGMDAAAIAEKRRATVNKRSGV